MVKGDCAGCGKAWRRGRLDHPSIEEFRIFLFSRVQPEPFSGCWLWDGSINQSGYGLIQFRGKTRTVHRVAYETFIGEIPDGLNVLHECDTRMCINPKHLFLGTYQDNSDDMMRKGRLNYRKGESANGHILYDCDVLSIRARHAAGGVTCLQMATEYGVSRSTITAIVIRQNWRHLP